MTNSPLDNLKLTTDSGTRTPEEFIDTIHDPDILYYYIKDAHKKTQQDLAIDADGKAAEINTHAKVEVFQSAMQYIEAFGIYLLAYIKGREELIKYLTKTRPGDVETFFEKLHNDEINDWLDTNNIDDNYQTVLEKIFGYYYFDSADHPDKGELTDDELRKQIDESTTALDHELRSIGQFYTTFRDIYNAVKHGNRALPQSESEFQITPSTDTDPENNTETDDKDGQSGIEVALDMNFVLFLCRNTNGKPYITILPIDYLLEHTLSVVEKTHSLFTHLKHISNAVITGELSELSFYKQTTDPESDTEPDWVMGQHPSGIIILPRTEETTALQTEPQELTFTARVECNNETLVIKTGDHDTISNEYPISVTFLKKGIVGLTPQSILGLTLNFTVADIDAIQYHELLQMQDLVETNDLNNVTIIDEQADEAFQAGEFDNFPHPNLEEFLDREYIEQTALLQKITQQHIPAPLDVSDEQKEIIADCIDTDLTREDAIDAVEELEQLGNNREHTVLTVEKLNPQREVLDSEIVNSLPGGIDFSFTDAAGKTYDNISEDIRVPTQITDITYEDLIESLQADPEVLDEILTQIPENVLEPAIPPRVYIQYTEGDDGFWLTTHELTFEVLSNEYEPRPGTQCGLCGHTTTDMKQHLLTECPILT